MSSSPAGGAGDVSAFSCLEVQFQRTRDSVTRLFDQGDYIRVSLIGNELGVRTLLDTKVFDTTAWGGPFDTTQKPLVRDNYDGSTAATNYITVHTNGIEVARLSPVNSETSRGRGG